MPPFTLAALRCTLASALLTALLWRGAGPREAPITRADLPALAVLGISGITVSAGIFYLAVTSAPAWGVVVFQGTLGTLSHIWYYRGVQTVGPSVTATFMNLQPLVGVLLATLLLGESVSVAQGLGAAAILGGVWLTTCARPGANGPLAFARRPRAC